MDKIIFAPMGPNFEVPTETKINHQLTDNPKKNETIPSWYLSSKENLSIDIGTSRIKDIVARNAFLFQSKRYFVDLGCKM